jgi:hypothetical protein
VGKTVAAGQIAGGQALTLGLIGQVVVDLVPTVMVYDVRR